MGTTGYIHSFDSFGTVDGPGIRFVVFTQGCPLRCKYCHNPDTWNTNTGMQMTAEQVAQKYEEAKGFATGGITVTGGEPLIQMEFITELFTLCKQRGVHTCVDTSGVTFNAQKVQQFNALMAVTDLVLLDIKHIDTEEHKSLTGVKNDDILAFAQYLSDIKKDVWIRHVVIEGITLNDDYLKELGSFLSKLKNIKALDIIPYHKMAEDKYKQLGLQYPLAGVNETSTDDTEHALNVIVGGIKQALLQKQGKPQ